MRSSNVGLQAKFTSLFFALLPLSLWLALHGYHGITGDGQIYAFQAFARLHPDLAADLYLQNTSQDQFTSFSPLYAWCIGGVGLENAARVLTLLFTFWLLAAAWSFASAVAGRDMAWLAAAFLLIVPGDYGASGVFRVLDPSLSARLPAEALIVTGLACHVRGMRRCSLLSALVALFIHPLMALPGLLLIVCLWLPVRVGVICAIGGVFVTLAMAGAGIALPAASPVLAIMDASWLEVVRERSQFLYLQLWSIRDWDINAQPFISLGLTAMVADERLRKLCATAALVGAAGLAVALIGGLIGPLAIVVQGQAWRWIWIATLIGAALVPVTVLQIWRDARCGPLCALFLVSSWTLPGIGGTPCVLLALLCWSLRTHISLRVGAHLRWLTAALGTAAVVWMSTKYLAIVSPPAASLGPAHTGATRDTFALGLPPVLLGTLIWWAIRAAWPTWVPTFLLVLLTAFSLLIGPSAFKQARTLGATAEVQEFRDWETAIPPSATVLVAPPRDAGAFVWFTLARPNYLALDQSSGVVFSRKTSLEVVRRSEVLLPLMDPDWKVRTDLARSGGGRKKGATTHPLTAKSLMAVCEDPQLGFVISPEMVGFDPLRHEHAGTWKDWNLYDCGKVRAAPAT